MAIDNSQMSIPKDVQGRLDNALNQITMANAELTRLSKLSKEQEETVNQRYSVAKSLEAQILSLTSNLEATKVDYDATYAKFQEIDGKKVSTQKEYEDVVTRLGNVKNELSAQQIEIVSRETSISDKEKEIEARSAALAEREVAHKEKVERLLAAIN